MVFSACSVVATCEVYTVQLQNAPLSYSSAFLVIELHCASTMEIIHASALTLVLSLYNSFPSLDLDLVTGERDSSDKASSTPTGDELPEDGSLTPVQRELDDLARGDTGEIDSAGGREASATEDMINIPSPIPEVDELIQNDAEDKVS